MCVCVCVCMCVCVCVCLLFFPLEVAFIKPHKSNVELYIYMCSLKIILPKGFSLGVGGGAAG